MRARVPLAALVLVLVGASCAADPDATRDNVVADLATYGDVDETCVGNVLAKYSDDELAAIDLEARRLQDPTDTRTSVPVSEAFRDLYAALFECVTFTS